MKVVRSHRARWLRLILVSGLLAGCATFEPSAQQPEPASPPPPQIAATPPPGREWFADALKSPVVENSKYGLQFIFKLAETKGENGSQPIKYVESVSLRDKRGGSEVPLAPGNSDDLLSSQEYFAEVWSPDEEYLVLPLNPFDGFCVMKAKGALKTARQHRCDDFIRVLNYRPSMEVKQSAYFHRWGKWETGAAFSFRAGLHGEERTYVYDAKRRELHDGEARSDDFWSDLKESVAKNKARVVGENKKGRVEITESFRWP